VKEGKFTIPKLTNKVSFGIGMVKTGKIPTDAKGKY
jgi:hypothetical protein